MDNRIKNAVSSAIKHESSKPPKNFSWLVDGMIAGFGFPENDDMLRFLVERNITRILTLTETRIPDVSNFPDMHVQALKVADFTPPTLNQIAECLAIIEMYNKMDQAVGVHCAQGLGRTGTVLACFMVKKYCISAAEAIGKLRELRPGSVETVEQENMVKLFEEHIRMQHMPLLDGNNDTLS